MLTGRWGCILLLLVVEFFSTQCFGSVWCYICVWASSDVIPGSQDTCRPNKLHLGIPVSDKCDYGCHVTVIHEYEPLRNGTRHAITQSSNCTEDSSLMEMPNMTFFARKCSEKPVTRDHCHIATMPGFRNEQRFCHTDYCNGEKGSAPLSRTAHDSISIIFSGILFLVATSYFLLHNAPGAPEISSLLHQNGRM